MAFKQRKFRAKITVDDEEEAEDGPPVIKPPSQAKKDAAAKPSAAPAVAKKESKAAKPSLLSFDEDVDDPGSLASKKDSKKDKQRASKLGRAPALSDLTLENAAQPSTRASAGEYTAERMKELQRNAISFSAARLAAPAADAGGAGTGGGGEPVIKLSGSFKPAGAPKDDRFSLPGGSNALVKPPPPEPDMLLPPPPRPGGAGSAAGAGAGAGAGGGAEAGGKPQAPGGAGAGAGAGAGGEGAEEDEDDDMGIPDEQTILAAKAKRERLRQAHLAPDYIPTAGLAGLSRLGGRGGGGGGGGGRRAGSAGPDGSGEGGEGGAGGSGSGSDEEAEEMMRIKFSGKEGAGGKAGRAKERDLGGYARQVGGDDDEDAFAEKQLQKALRLQQVGGAGTAPPPPPAAAAAAAGPGPGSAAAAAAAAAAAGGYPPPAVAGGAGAYPFPSNHMRAGGGLGGGAFAGGGMGMAAGGSRMAAIQAAGDGVVAALAEGLKRLHTSHKQVQHNAKRTSENLATSLSRAEGLEAELRAAGDKYEYVQRLRAYVADLCDCLQVKSAIVEELEDSRGELMEDRAAAARSAAAAAARDLAAPAEAAVAAAMAALSRGATAAAAGAAAEAAARDAEDKLLDEEGPVELDEFGRNVNLQRRRELEARAEGRKRLLAREGERLAAAAAGGVIQPLERDGEPEDEQASRYATRYGEMCEAAAHVFADADEEYATIAAVKKQLEEWKARYPKDYTNAYMHLSTPALFAPYVRLQLLRWDPLYGGGGGGEGAGAAGEGAGGGGGGGGGTGYSGFDTQEWYTELFEYGMAADGDAAAAVSDDDPDSELVPQLVRKLVLPLALHWIDRCWDVRSVPQTRAVAALAAELLVYVPAEEERMVELLGGVRGALEVAAEAAALPPWPPAVLAASPTAARVAFHRFRCALRLLHCVSAFEGLLARGLLVGLALGKLVAGSLMPYLRGAAAGAGLGGGEGMGLAVSTSEAVAAALHPDWFAGGAAPAEAVVFLEHVASLARGLEQQARQPDAGGARAGLARRLAAVLARLGDGERGARLAAAYGIRGA
ncbi:hypothetical protein HYH02_015353 [Chlamydomonas schloesseri]|uniref:GCF C-terminal domain-containing protein n=1 Tax=Chlamydomonas schloesseri TaxID=2026947 RepID=A0A835VNE5_9CHLO|nr:hypothetical protein HYH02_015353 [Chlamydomonas schloesseri]|eukprot:KAG2423252.1 hypothetical protein HYH02_015353 [Chlamydomonas schloesseri]